MSAGEDGAQQPPLPTLERSSSKHEEAPLDAYGFTDEDRADMLRRKQMDGKAPEMPNCCSQRAARPPTFANASRATGDGVPSSYQNAGCIGCETSKGLYCTPTPADVDLPKLPLGFAYDFEPRGFGYPSEKLGPATPLECCSQCVCCQLCGQICEPSCCDQGLLAESIADLKEKMDWSLPKSPQSDLKDKMDCSCMDCLNICQFMPCFPLLMSMPGCVTLAPCLETCGICGPCDWTKTCQSLFDCMPCTEQLALGKVPCFFSCWYSVPCNFRCRPCVACQGVQCDPVGCCRGWSCHCYRSSCLPACCCCTPCCKLCEKCPQCPKCPRIKCPGCPNCCCCLEGCTQTTETSCVLCPGFSVCGCLCRNHAGCHPCCTKCPCLKPVKRNPGGVWLSPFETLDGERGTNGNFFYNKQTDFVLGIDATPMIHRKHVEESSPRLSAAQAVAAEMDRGDYEPEPEPEPTSPKERKAAAKAAKKEAARQRKAEKKAKAAREKEEARLAKERAEAEAAEAEAAEAAAAQEAADVRAAEEALEQARASGDEAAIKAAEERLAAEMEQAQSARLKAEEEREQAAAAEVEQAKEEAEAAAAAAEVDAEAAAAAGGGGQDARP